MAESGNVKERIALLQQKEAEAWASIESEITEMRTANDSIIALLDQVKQRLDVALNSGNITERVIAIKQFMDEEQQRLADAVIRNTPAENPVADEDDPENPPVDETPVEHPQDEVPDPALDTGNNQVRNDQSGG